MTVTDHTTALQGSALKAAIRIDAKVDAGEKGTLISNHTAAIPEGTAAIRDERK